MAFINQRMIQLMNLRIKNEELSSRLYKSMSLWLNHNGYLGASKLWDKYSKEETQHAEIGYQYLLDLDILPEVSELSKPQSNFEGLVDICKKSYEHELEIIEQINLLAKVSVSEDDFMTLQLAQNYLMEQREEISKNCTWLDRIDSFGTDKVALRLLDEEMGKA